MPPATDQTARPLTRAERKQLLVLACAIDRAAWGQACRPRTHPSLQLAGRFLQMLAPVTALLPGRVGRWLRGANLFARVGRRLSWLIS